MGQLSQNLNIMRLLFGLLLSMCAMGASALSTLPPRPDALIRDLKEYQRLSLGAVATLQSGVDKDRITYAEWRRRAELFAINEIEPALQAHGEFWACSRGDRSVIDALARVVLASRYSDTSAPSRLLALVATCQGNLLLQVLDEFPSDERCVLARRVLFTLTLPQQNGQNAAGVHPDVVRRLKDANC